MLITRTSPRTGKPTTLDLPVTLEQLSAYALNRGLLIQHAFPDLTPGEREFIKTGFTEADWAAMFPPEDDEEEQP